MPRPQAGDLGTGGRCGCAAALPAPQQREARGPRGPRHGWTVGLRLGARCPPHTPLQSSKKTATPNGQKSGSHLKGAAGGLTYISRVVFQERASEGTTTCTGAEGKSGHTQDWTLPGRPAGVRPDLKPEDPPTAGPGTDGNQPGFKGNRSVQTQDEPPPGACLSAGMGRSLLGAGPDSYGDRATLRPRGPSGKAPHCCPSLRAGAPESHVPSRTL